MTYDRHMSIFQPITSSVRWRTEVFKIKGFVRKRFLRSPPPPPSFLFLLSPHFSRGRNAENPVFRSFLHGNACYAGYFGRTYELKLMKNSNQTFTHQRKESSTSRCSARLKYTSLSLKKTKTPSATIVTETAHLTPGQTIAGRHLNLQHCWEQHVAYAVCHPVATCCDVLRHVMTC